MTVAAAPPPSADAPFEPQRAPFLWLCEREIIRFLKIWPYTIAGHAISGLLFVIVFGLALSGHVSGLDGVPYERFIVPGIAMQSVITVGFFNGTTTLYEARHEGYIHDVLASPLRWWEINAALVVGSAVRGALTGLAVLAIAMPITGVGVARPLVLLVTCVALLVAAAQAGILVGTYYISVDRIYAVEMLVLIPLGFLAGTFYTVSQLPHAWAVLTHFNPLFYFVEGMRLGLLGKGEIGAGLALAVVVAVALVLSAWSLAVFRTGAQLKP